MLDGNDIAVDSLKIRIPLSKCEVLKPELTQKYVLVGSELGDIDPTYFKENSYVHQLPFHNTRYLIRGIGSGKIRTLKYVIIGLNAKILGSRYFEGITKDTLRLAYDKLMEQKVISVSYLDFCNYSACTDIDFKYDFTLMEGQEGEPILLFKEFTQQLYSITHPKYRESITERFPKKKEKGIASQGIQWGKARQYGTERKPFVKFYNKQLHIQKEEKMRGFANTYLSKEEAEAVRFRVEVTIKNKKALDWHKVDGNTLFDLVNITGKQKLKMLTKCIKVYLVDTNPKPNKARNMKEAWYIKFITRTIELLIQEKKPYAYIMNYCTMDFDKHQRHKYKPVIDDIYNKYVGNDKLTDPPLEVMGWFNMLGLIK